jgi:hypothetical protein
MNEYYMDALFIYIYKSESMFVAILVGMFLGMYTINSLTP